MTPKLPKYLTLCSSSGRYRYRHPDLLKVEWLGRDRRAAITWVEQYLALAKLAKQEHKQRNDTAPTVSYVIDQYIKHVVPEMAWSDGTLNNRMPQLNLYKREFGTMLINACKSRFIGDWIKALGGQASNRNIHRANLIRVWDYAISLDLVDVNEPARTMKANQAKRIKANQKTRTRLQLDQFLCIYHAPSTESWLSRAMELALITRQGRMEICNMRYPDDGYFYVIRQKTAERNDMAFMKFPITPDLQRIVNESRTDNIACPYIIHTSPLSRRPQNLANKTHWAAITPGHMSKCFARARDAAGVGANLEPRQKPTFHEIRSLGGRLLKSQGWTDEDLQQGYGHADMSVTTRYLTDDQSLLKEHYREVRVDMDVSVLRASGKG